MNCCARNGELRAQFKGVFVWPIHAEERLVKAVHVEFAPIVILAPRAKKGVTACIVGVDDVAQPQKSANDFRRVRDALKSRVKIKSVIEGMALAEHCYITQQSVAFNNEVQIGMRFSSDVGQFNRTGRGRIGIFIENGEPDRRRNALQPIERFGVT